LTSATILYIILIAAVALAMAVFLYAFKTAKKVYGLMILRALSLFLIGLLLLNPTFNKKTYQVIKPSLAVFVDNSKSIDYLNKKDEIKSFVATIQEDKALNEAYTIDYYAFANELKIMDSLSFDGSQTKINDLIDFTAKTYTNNAKALLISDGNQTIGSDYSFLKSKTPIIPIVVGDTTSHPDLYIDQVNVNKYSYIKNKFPVEVFTNYTGNKVVNTSLQIYHKRKLLASKVLHFTADKTNFHTTFTVEGKQKGLQSYALKIKPLVNEKNTRNNTKKFAIDIIDNKRKIVIISSINHPDIAALKRSIQSNEQLEITIKKPRDKINWNNYQLAILYQPNTSFKNVFEQIKKQQKNYFVLTGLETNWQFLNHNQEYFNKKPSGLKEQVFPSKNRGFDVFQFKNIEFDKFSPLATRFGAISVKGNQQVILKENIRTIATDYPLLTMLTANGVKAAILDGEGIWHWRMEHFKAKQNFTTYDTFWVNLVQYLSSNKKIERLAITYEKTHYQNDKIVIDANFVDENYEFDASKTLVLKLRNTATKKTKTYQFVLDNAQYKVAVDGLNPGNYSFSVIVLGTNFKKYGRLTVLDFDIEKQFTRANYQALSHLAKPDTPYLLINATDALAALKKDKQLKPIQQETITKTALVDWKWLLPIILMLFALEWFIRKYRGMI
jgi:hypothetical protein